MIAMTRWISSSERRGCTPDKAPDDDADRDLMRRLARRDEAAFEVFFRRYHRRIYQFVLRVLRNPPLTEETVNDVMLVVWTSADRFAAQSKVSSWVFGIAYRKALKALQRESRHPASGEDCDRYVDSAGNGDPQDAQRVREQMARLDRGLALLPADKRIVVELVAMGHSYPEIAEIAGCPENTVKTRMFHARRLLRAAMGDGEES